MAFLKSFVLLSVAAFVTGSGPRLNSFKVTFDPIHGYNDLPTDIFTALNNGWKGITKADEGCTNGGKYNGFRLIYGDDSSISLLVDIAGNVVGIQMNINQTSVNVPNNNYKYDAVPMYVNDVINGLKVYTLTAYFVDPSIICTSGRTEDSVANDGTATGVYLQNGPTPANTIQIPYKRADAIAAGWTKNNCFVGMGYHNFFQSEKYQDTQCTAFRPVFGLYGADDQIQGFGLTSVGKAYSANNRYEYPSSGAIKLIVGNDARLSPCLTETADNPGVTTMHVFLTGMNRGYTCL
jgi:hypothetical protein